MKKGVVLGLVLISFLIVSLSFISASWFGDLFSKITGQTVQETENGATGVPNFGPSEQEQTCMKKCVTDAGCVIGDISCSEENNCLTKCSIVKPEETEEQKCVSVCAQKGCATYDFACQSKNQEACDKECGMVKEPEAKSEEEQCIRDCVNKESPGLICQAAEGGEKGNEICQKCAEQCVYLYAGPCLNHEQLKAKQKECETCEHCYGSPVMGDSGEGYDCNVDVECKDATSEFGDEPGEGAGIVERAADFVGDTLISIRNFVSDVFSSSEENSEESSSSSESVSS